MAFILILLFILFIISFISFFVCIFMDLELLGVVMISLWIFTPVLFYILLSFHTKRYPKNGINNYNHFNIANSSQDITILVYKENGYWICKCQENQVKMDLKGYLFQKSYILAYINRQIKYPLHQLTVRQFFKCKLNIKKYKDINIYVNFGKKSKKILCNGVLKQSILCQLISQIRYIKKYLFMKTALSFSKEKIRKNADEKDYLNNKLC